MREIASYTFPLPRPEPAPLTWVRQKRAYQHKTGVIWWLNGTDWCVRHCGHPTANYPWYGIAPDGEMILAPNGRGFFTAKEAKEAVLALYLHLHPPAEAAPA